MPNAIDHALALVLVVVAPPYAAWSFRRLRGRIARGGGAARRAAYRGTMVTQWTLTIALLAHWRFAARPFSDLALMPPSGWGAAVAILLLATLVGIFLFQQAHADDSALQEAIRSKLAPVESILPHDDDDERRFMGVAITAGVCEEVLYRGFLTWYAVQFLPTFVAVPAVALAFGLAHSYQGVRGIVTTTIVGLVMAGFAALAASLWVAMAVHALVDLNSGLLARRVLAATRSGDDVSPTSPAPAESSSAPRS
jgi:membrane protease YdiL (CAAX protease family)